MKRRIQKYISVFMLSALLLAAGYGEAKKCHGDRTLVLFRHQGQYEDIEKELCYTRFRYSEEAKGASVRYIDPQIIKLQVLLLLRHYVFILMVQRIIKIIV